VEAWRSDNYGIAWFQTGLNGVEDTWVSATGQFVAGVSNPQGGGISYVVYSTDYGRSWAGVNMTTVTGSGTTYRTINGSADGSILVLGSVNSSEGSPSFTGDGLLRIARQGRPSYSLSGVLDVELVHTGIVNLNSGVYTLDWANRIDLTKYNIKYEISINYSYLASQSTNPAFIELGLNSVRGSSIGSGSSFFQRPVVTNWTNTIIQGSPGLSDVFNQTHRHRFYCGYRPPSTWGPDYRNRQYLSGELSMNRRATADPFYAQDATGNSYEILNKFTSDHYILVKNQFTTEHYIYTPDYSVLNDQHQRIHGSSLWNPSAGNQWANNLAIGINNITLYFSDQANQSAYYARPAEIQYRIYRVRK
jgi:hypothetical protein